MQYITSKPRHTHRSYYGRRPHRMDHLPIGTYSRSISYAAGATSQSSSSSSPLPP
uniref:Uncharacterized protein n=1 Tax=Arundo donax TaxID=35708 RepID=A0A0A8Y5M1_ARUDO